MSLGITGRRRPDAVTWILFYVVVLYAIPSRLVVGQFGSAGAPSMLIGLASFGAWAIYQFSRPTSTASPDHVEPVRRAAVLFLLCIGVSYVVAMSRPIDFDEVSPANVAVVSVLSWSGTLLVANDGIASLERIKVLAAGLSWAAAAMAVLGLLQFATNDPIVDRIAIPGLRAADFEVFARGGFVRPSGTATHPIEFGIILAMILPFALHTAFQGVHRNRLTQWLPVFAIGVAMAMTFSRSAYISIGVAVVILILGWPPRRRRAFGVGLLFMVAALFASVPRLFGTIRALFTNVGNDPSVDSRTDSYALAFDFLDQRPFFGRGLGTFLPKYRIFDNEYLQLLVSVGVVGTLAFLVLALTGMAAALSVYRKATDPDVRDLELTIVASLAAGTVSFAMFDSFAFPMTMGTYFLVLGMAGAVCRLARQQRRIRQAGDPPAPRRRTRPSPTRSRTSSLVGGTR